MRHEALRVNFAQHCLFQSITLCLPKSFLALFGGLHVKSRTEGSRGFRKMSWHFLMECGRPRSPKLRQRRPVALHEIGENVPNYFPSESANLNLEHFARKRNSQLACAETVQFVLPAKFTPRPLSPAPLPSNVAPATAGPFGNTNASGDWMKLDALRK